MSVENQFKNIGEIGIALGIWAIIIWLFYKPKRILFLLLVILILVFFVNLMLDDTGEKFYVNTNTLELLDKPFGVKKMTLKMNDSLTLVEEMSDDWLKVAVGFDTLYFKENFYCDRELGWVYKIKKTPFSKWKALIGQKAVFNHPDGYLDSGTIMMKTGDTVTILRYLKLDSSVRIESSKGRVADVPLKYIKIDWEQILKRYPNLK